MTDFGGRMISARSVGEITLTETLYRPDMRLERHSHDAPYFCFVRRGSFREQLRRGSTLHGPSDVIFHPAGEVHEDLFLGDGAHCFNVEIRPSLIGNLRAGEVPASARIAVARTMKHLQAEHRRGNPSSLVIEGLVYQALGEAFERREGSERGRRGWLEAVREDIEERYGEPLSIASLAARAGVHGGHLCRAFRQDYGQSVAGFVRDVRVGAAKTFLEDGQSPLAEIALATGFADQSHFSRVFKQAVGMTPAVYRRRHSAK
jgi:AraC family transcriptional regulator